MLKNSIKISKIDLHRQIWRNFGTNDIKNIKSKYDAIVIGAGHNGLVAANYLAKFSPKPIKICLLEQRHVVGGAAVTEQIIPGFKFSRASYLLSLFRPQIIQDLDLMRHGILKFYTRNPSSYTPLLPTDSQYTKSTSLTLSSNSKFNYEQIAQFSPKDAQNFQRYETWLNNVCEYLEPFMDKAPPSAQFIKNSSTVTKLRYLKKYVPDLKTAKFFAHNFDDLYRLFSEPAANLLNEWFESDVLKATLATDSVIGAFLSPYSEGSAYVLLHHIIGGIDGQKGVWAYVEGGMGSVSDCLAKNLESFGDQVEIYVSQEVDKIELEESDQGFRSKGVLLKNGAFIESDCILSNCTPRITFEKFLKSYDLEKSQDDQVASFIKRIKNINYDSGTMKINLAVNKLPNFTANPNLSHNKPMPHHQCTIHINCENMQLLDDAFLEAKMFNRPSETPMIEMVIPSSLDPTLAPDGSHVVLLFCQYFPIDRENNAQSKQKYAEIVFNSIEKYAPGFKDSIVGIDILAPFDLEQTFGLSGGNIFHGAMPLSQLFINRPVSGWSSYKTPVKNLYLAGSGAHPGGGFNGQNRAFRLPEKGLQKSLNTRSTISTSSSIILKSAIFTAGFTGACYSIAVIVNYERVRMKKQISFGDYPKFSELRQKINNYWNSLPDVKKVAALIVFVNSLVFIAWRVPALQNGMRKYFLLSPASGISSQMIFSTFSHVQLFHIFFNMLALYSLSDLISKILPVEQFAAYYLSSGVFASFMSTFFKVLRSNHHSMSLGASGAIVSCFALSSLVFPNSKFYVFPIPFEIEAQTLFKFLVGFDLLFLLIGSRKMDHAAHLGGALYGW
ncbi:pyridine nucleotide-disulfide oxidoreductase domain-containing 2 [Brachionus plicatilis]|uniref:Pyridine nucleotide-disulfide oxidoreductase domain-containing 2 n=1 Tax=Brachionus plicatilis TaxID=10195 RepID=A0A3M7R0T4_BRAPC|nr:pyridine nucleotide-disulfide oxidoreductase domain-containing 2 [Brachionus plicatilis]